MPFVPATVTGMAVCLLSVLLCFCVQRRRTMAVLSRMVAVKNLDGIDLDISNLVTFFGGLNYRCFPKYKY